MQKVEWPGRFQKLHHARDIIYDGAHNPDSARALAGTLREVYPGRPIHLILAIQAEKDLPAFLAPFAGMDISLYAAGLPAGRHPQTAAALAASLREAGFKPLHVAESMAQAIEKATSDNPDAVTVIAGSLYAAQLIPEPLWPRLEG